MRKIFTYGLWTEHLIAHGSCTRWQGGECFWLSYSRGFEQDPPRRSLTSYAFWQYPLPNLEWLLRIEEFTALFNKPLDILREFSRHPP